jgi:PAS domain S-box-containing protein
MSGAESGEGAAAMQERLMRSLFEESHVSMWACDAEFRIVLWNRGAVSIYGRSADSVLGRRYDELFIDDAEREQSLADCKAIIENGTRYTNFLALDHDAKGRERQMLTNCFRITDPKTGQHYQAEIGVDIADLEVSQRELRTLRELGIKQMLERKQTLQIRRTHLETLISAAEEEVRVRAEARLEEIDRAIRNVSPRLRADRTERYEQRRDAVQGAEAEALGELSEIRARLKDADSVEETLVLEEILGSRGNWAGRISGAG